MTEMDKLKQLARDTAIENSAREFSVVLLLSMVVNDIHPYTAMRAFQIALIELISTSFLKKSDERFNATVSACAEGIRLQAVEARRKLKEDMEKK